MMGQQSSGDACDDAGKGERQDFQAKHVHTHGFGGNFIVANRLEGAAVGGPDQQHHENDAARSHSPGPPHGGEARQALEAQRPVGDRLHIGQDHADDFGKSQSGNGQIVVAQAQGDEAQNPAHQTREKACQQQGRHEGYLDLRQPRCDGLQHVVDRFLRRRHGQDGAGVRANGHEAGVTQAEQARESVDQVQRQGQNHVDGAELEDLHGEGVETVLEHEQQDHKANQCAQREQVVAQGKRLAGWQRIHHTFSPCLLPSKPVGLTSSTTISSTKANASL